VSVAEVGESGSIVLRAVPSAERAEERAAALGLAPEVAEVDEPELALRVVRQAPEAPRLVARPRHEAGPHAHVLVEEERREREPGRVRLGVDDGVLEVALRLRGARRPGAAQAGHGREDPALRLVRRRRVGEVEVEAPGQGHERELGVQLALAVRLLLALLPAALGPEVVDVAQLLRLQGAKVADTTEQVEAPLDELRLPLLRRALDAPDRRPPALSPRGLTAEDDRDHATSPYVTSPGRTAERAPSTRGLSICP
jgi:hypothetical protein